MVLAEAMHSQSQAATEGCSSSPAVSATAETVELQARALMHVSRRVAQLEEQLQRTQRALEVEQQFREELVTVQNTSSKVDWETQVIGLGPGEIDAVDAFVLSRGIRLRTNVAIEATRQNSAPSSIVSCCLSIEHQGVSFLHFFRRTRMAECLFSQLVDAEFDSEQRRFILHSSDGALFEVFTDSDLTLHVAHKLLYFKKGAPIPQCIPQWVPMAEENGKKTSTEVKVVAAESSRPPTVPCASALETTVGNASAQDKAGESTLTSPAHSQPRSYVASGHDAAEQHSKQPAVRENLRKAPESNSQITGSSTIISQRGESSKHADSVALGSSSVEKPAPDSRSEQTGNPSSPRALPQEPQRRSSTAAKLPLAAAIKTSDGTDSSSTPDLPKRTPKIPMTRASTEQASSESSPSPVPVQRRARKTREIRELLIDSDSD